MSQTIEAIAAGNEALRRLKILLAAAKYALPTISVKLAADKLEEAIKEAEGG